MCAVVLEGVCAYDWCWLGTGASVGMCVYWCVCSVVCVGVNVGVFAVMCLQVVARWEWRWGSCEG